LTFINKGVKFSRLTFFAILRFHQSIGCKDDMSQHIDAENLDFLLAQVCRLHYIRAHQLLEGIGLYRGQPPVLHALWEQEGLTQSELAERLNVSPATMTKMLQRMERAGFVLRMTDADDQRVSRVFLTEAGRSIKSSVESIFQTMETETFAGFTAQERDLLRRFLRQIRKNLEQAAGEKTSP